MDSVIHTSKQFETMGVISVLALIILTTWFWIIPKLWARITEKDEQIKALTEITVKMTDAINSSIERQRDYMDEVRRAENSIDTIKNSLFSLDAFIRSALSSGQKKGKSSDG